MARISKYGADTTVTISDKLLGTDVDGATKNYTLGDIGSFVQTNYSNLDIANGVNNRIITASDADSLNGEANLTFDGSTLTVTGDLTVGVDDTGHDVKFFGDTAGKYILWDASDDALEFPDNTKLKIGTDGDLTIWHNTDAGHSSITSNGTGILAIESLNDDVTISATTSKGVYLYVGGQNGIRTFHGGASELFYANVKRFNTASTGATVTGVLTVTTDADITGSALVTQNLRRTVTTASDSSNTHTCTLIDNDNFNIACANAETTIALVVATENIGQSGMITITNHSSGTTFAALPSYMLTPEGATINFVTTADAVSIISYYVLATDKVLVNYVGNFA
jgi:hypothetical protein